MADNESRMEKTVNSLKEEYKSIRTGRASAAIFDKVRVDYYGTPTPLNQVGNISIPEARTIVISPFDKSIILLQIDNPSPYPSPFLELYPR